MSSKAGGKRPGAGRPAGSKTINATQPDIKELCKKYSGECVESLINIVRKSKFEGNKIAAISQILDRGFGKPTSTMGIDPNTPKGKFTISWED